MEDKVILVDGDGVCFNWEYPFDVWMGHHGHRMIEGGKQFYNIGKRYKVQNYRKYVRGFNESAAIGFLPPLRDAMHYIDLLHRKHGYVFHMITSLSKDPYAQNLRVSNAKKLFGETAFDRFIFCDCGADKDEALEPYRDSGYIWIEDKVENAELGQRLGLQSILMSHGYNMESDIPRVRNWKQFYNEYI